MERTGDIRVNQIFDDELATLLSHGSGTEDALRHKLAQYSTNFGPLYRRDIINLLPDSTTSSEQGGFVVKQFNLLAEGLSAPAAATPPFPANEASCYGGFDSVDDADTVFDFSRFRRWRLIDEIMRPGSEPDILSVQECDHFADFFEPVLRILGYDGVYVPKAKSPCLRFGYFSDGVALFWRRCLFEPAAAAPIVPGPDAGGRVTFAGLALRHTPSGRSLFVATCHLKAKKGAEMEAIRLSQIKYILSAIEKESTEKIMGPVLLMGDFNTAPSAHSDAGGNVIDYVENWNNRFLASAYPFERPIGSSDRLEAVSLQTYSTWKSRGGVEAKHLIDYIWYSRPHFDVQWILDTPNLEDIERSRSKLPDIRYPSDHCAISAKIRFL